MSSVPHVSVSGQVFGGQTTVGHALQELESQISGLDPKYLVGRVTCKPSELFLRNSY